MPRAPARPPSPPPVISSTRRPEPHSGTRDPARTRRNLLDAAYHEFSTHGFHGTTVERICTRAQVSKQLLSHHFGSKEGAHLAVLEQAYAAARITDVHLTDPALPAMEALRAFVGATFDHLAGNRAFVHLQADENVSRGAHIRKSGILSAVYDPLIDTLAQLLARGVAEGAFRAGVDPRDLYVSVSALCYFYFSNAYTLSAAFETDMLEVARLTAWRTHVVDFVANGLRA